MMFESLEINEIKNQKTLKLFGFKYGWYIEYPKPEEKESIKQWCSKNCKEKYSLKFDHTEIFEPKTVDKFNNNDKIIHENFHSSLSILFKSEEDSMRFKNSWC